ncbi:MAG TPA: thioesterase family protein [Solirubrobacteraceae bacterium]|nr:thioesterase family protein [Solirubrobacteraceae bacterium]
MTSVYELRDRGVFATEYARGPWDPRHQHGGAPAALMMRAFEALDPDPGLAIVRVTYELLRPVPLGALSVDATTVRPGRRVQLLEGSIHTPEGVEVLRARALRVRRPATTAGGSASADPAGSELVAGPLEVPGSPDGVEPSGFASADTLFPGDAMEIRFVRGSFFTPGPATAWFRLRVPVVAGESPSPLQRMAAAADFPNGIATELDWNRYVFINPDLTLSIERPPVGEWIALTAAMSVDPDGGGIAQAVLHDARGRIGRSLQSLYVAERD